MYGKMQHQKIYWYEGVVSYCKIQHQMHLPDARFILNSSWWSFCIVNHSTKAPRARARVCSHACSSRGARARVCSHACSCRCARAHVGVCARVWVGRKSGDACLAQPSLCGHKEGRARQVSLHFPARADIVVPHSPMKNVRRYLSWGWAALSWPGLGLGCFQLARLS